MEVGGRATPLAILEARSGGVFAWSALLSETSCVRLGVAEHEGTPVVEFLPGSMRHMIPPAPLENVAANTVLSAVTSKYRTALLLPKLTKVLGVTLTTKLPFVSKLKLKAKRWIVVPLATSKSPQKFAKIPGPIEETRARDLVE